MAEQKVIMTDPRQEDYFYQEAIKTLRTNIQFAGMDVKTILFTSCYPNEGKSDITFQLSQEIGKLGKKVLLLDADIRKSILASRYGVGKQVQGLSNYLSGQASIAEIIYRTNYENMDIIFSGSFAPNPSELLGQEAFGTLLGAVREHYDYIIVDTPPIGSIIDAAIVAKQCDGAVLVFESELVSSKEAARVKEQLLMTGCRLIGAVLNKVDVKKNKYYHRYDYYYHGYQEKKEVTKKQMKKKKYLKWWIAAVSAVFIVGAGIFVYTQYKAAQTSGDVATKDGTSASASDITWNGKTYSYNEHLSNFLFLGIDTKEKAETKTGQADAGQADALYLLSWNRLEGDITVISIPRDTMTQIETFGPGGKSLGKSKDHISLSYAYGDGGYESCELAENAVSELLYGLPIDGYCALNMDGLPVLTDSVGGVTVTVPNDSLAEVDPGYAKGAVVTLKGEDTEQFVRYRNTEISQSAIARMERQQEYIRAFGEALKKASADKALVTDLYKAIEPYMVTNMGKSRFVDLTESVSEGKKVNRWTIPGEGIQGKEYDEYVVDDDALYEKTVETFYVEKK